MKMKNRTIVIKKIKKLENGSLQILQKKPKIQSYRIVYKHIFA